MRDGIKKTINKIKEPAIKLAKKMENFNKETEKMQEMLQNISKTNKTLIEADNMLRGVARGADKGEQAIAKATVGLGMAVLESTQCLVENIYKSTRMLNDSVVILNQNIENFNKSSSKLTEKLVLWTKILAFATAGLIMVGVISIFC